MLLAVMNLFAAVKIIKTPPKAFHRSRDVITHEKIDIDGEKFFYLITVTTCRKEVPRQAVLSYAGRLGKFLLFPDGKGKENEILACRRLFNQSLKMLKNQKSEQVAGFMCVYDKYGVYTDRVQELIPFAASLHIICPIKGAYEAVLEKILCEYGLSLTVSEKWNRSADRCDTVIAYDSDILPVYYKGRVFSAKKRCLPDCRFVVGTGIVLPTEYDVLLPESISKAAFASLLYERCGVTQAENWPYEKILYY